ncbi:MAG: hypothetical protein MJ211_13095 [Bacteroidales bacterium]|nr:hypothetical protein [Bacteroidales bacterium]
MKKGIVIIFLLIVSITSGYSQQKTSSSGWKSERQSVFGGVGYNFFMGDLGGGKGEAAHFFGIRDVDLACTRPSFQLGYAYRCLEQLTARAHFTYSMIHGDDAESANIYRQARNLNFKSNLFEFGFTADYYFVKEKRISRFNTFESVGQWRKKISAYFFLGFDAIMFNPKGKLDGKWYKLQPLCTEGQGTGVVMKVVDEYSNTITIPTEKSTYKTFAFSIPIGLGVKYSLNNKMAISLEISNHYTTSDYIDDVSSDYYFNYEQEGITPPNELTTKFADRHFDVDENNNLIDPSAPYKSGHMRRGNSGYNDAYLITMICFHYKLPGSIFNAKPKYY